MELLHKHAVKPNSKSLREEPLDVKILCTLWYEICVRNEILYRTGKEVDDEWWLVIQRDKQMEILSLLHDSKTAGNPGMFPMELTVSSRFYWPRMRNDIKILAAVWKTDFNGRPVETKYLKEQFMPFLKLKCLCDHNNSVKEDTIIFYSFNDNAKS